MPKDNKQGNKYDKIFRENMQAALPGIIKHVLKLNIVQGIDLPDNIQHTKERKPDLLQKVTDNKGKNFVLHLEYQTKNEKKMPFRMADYNIMLQWKYELPVEQYVIFIGSEKMTMSDRIISKNLQFRYNLIALSSIDYKIFLKSDRPEEKILAILANFEKDNPETAIENILQGVKISAGSSFAESKYFRQLRVLVQLRNLEPQFNKAMESITEFFKEEKDPLYRKGEAKGEARGEAKERKKLITNLIEKLGLSDEQVANTVEVSVEFVQKIRKKLQK